MPGEPHLVLVVGVAGSGKTTVARLLAERLGWPYQDADDFPSEGNRSKDGPRAGHDGQRPDAVAGCSRGVDGPGDRSRSVGRRDLFRAQAALQGQAAGRAPSSSPGVSPSQAGRATPWGGKRHPGPQPGRRMRAVDIQLRGDCCRVNAHRRPPDPVRHVWRADEQGEQT
ncbi:shikimate kinase [Streptomyces sp. YS415]|uniref:shikimate kinase n=1 Tax=Streptomyces sp. YS415 TaxID=2944806 RepID=UPI0035AB7030